jgi:hypothetical protein
MECFAVTCTTRTWHDISWHHIMLECLLHGIGSGQKNMMQCWMYPTPMEPLFYTANYPVHQHIHPLCQSCSCFGTPEQAVSAQQYPLESACQLRAVIDCINSSMEEGKNVDLQSQQQHRCHGENRQPCSEEEDGVLSLVLYGPHHMSDKILECHLPANSETLT